ncbi:MAG: glycoside hydrolase family 3 [Candidatus Cloacimonetes bacterium]|nr:glycoside hydrolase family 3 [Candidatus Cloacimonadota bacterium]
MQPAHAAGRLLFIGFRGLTIADEPALAPLAAAGLIGGVLLLQRNCSSREQLQSLCHSLHELPSPHRLRICIDQEGGSVQRLPWHDMPSARDVAAGMSSDEAEALYEDMAHELKACGVDWNLAPVVDLDIDPLSPAIGAGGRSFGVNADTVSEFAGAFLRAHRKAGVKTCLKHYPGHGSAGVDTHEGLADITDTWRQTELLPYSNLLQQGLVDAVMPGHLLHRECDAHCPATLSAAHLRYLHEKLGWDGVVVSDDMQMGALSAFGSAESLMLQALHAGADVLLAGNWLEFDITLARRWNSLVQSAINQGELPPERLRQAIQRLERMFGV